MPLEKEMPPYAAALVGLGNMACRYALPRRGSVPVFSPDTHAGAYMLHPRVRLQGGASLSPEHRGDFEDRTGLPVFESIEDMLCALAPKIVSVCSPSAFHERHVLLCAEAGVSMIWLEKPPADSLSALDRMLALSGSLLKDVTVLVNFHRRYAPAWRIVRTLLADQKKLGEICSVEVSYSLDLFSNGIHFLDLLFFLFPSEADNVSAFSLFSVQQQRELPSFSFLLGDIPVVFSGVQGRFHFFEMRITGQRGRLVAHDGGNRFSWEELRENRRYPGFFHFVPDALPEPLAGAERFGMEGFMLYALEDLIMSHEQRHLPASTLVSSRHSLAVAERVYSEISSRGASG